MAPKSPSLLKIYPLYTGYFCFCSTQVIYEDSIIQEDYEYSPGVYDTQIENGAKIEILVTNFREALKHI